MRPRPRTIWLVSTLKRPSSPIKPSAIGFPSGSTVTYRAGFPNPASATATLASPPPKVATKRGDCSSRSKPGGASRNIVSPNVTTSLDVQDQNTGGRPYYAGRFLNYLDCCITV